MENKHFATVISCMFRFRLEKSGLVRKQEFLECFSSVSLGQGSKIFKIKARELIGQHYSPFYNLSLFQDYQHQILCGGPLLFYNSNNINKFHSMF